MQIEEQITRDAAQLQKKLSRWLLETRLPMEACLVAARLFVRAGEAALAHASHERCEDYKSALAISVEGADRQIREKGMTVAPFDSSGPNSLQPCADGNPERMTARELSDQAAQLTTELGRLVSAAGYSLEVFALACFGVTASSEAVLKSEPDGRFEKYQMALAIARNDIATALKMEGVEERPSS